MKLNAVAVISKNIPQTIRFYMILGFSFPEISPKDTHVETIKREGEAKLMIDTADFMKDFLHRNPVPATHSTFGVEYDTPAEIDKIVEELKKANFTVINEPWDAFWGQHYAIVQDPDGYMVDLYSHM